MYWLSAQVGWFLKEKGSGHTTEESKKSAGKDKKKKNKKERNTMSLDEFNKLDSHSGSRNNSGEKSTPKIFLNE